MYRLRLLEPWKGSDASPHGDYHPWSGHQGFGRSQDASQRGWKRAWCRSATAPVSREFLGRPPPSAGRYGVRPFDKDAVERRIRARELQLGIRHMAQSAKSEKKNHRRGFTWAHLEALVRPRPKVAMSGGLLCGCSW
jgi:hypothetical protein